MLEVIEAKAFARRGENPPQATLQATHIPQSMPVFHTQGFLEAKDLQTCSESLHIHNTYLQRCFTPSRVEQTLSKGDKDRELPKHKNRYTGTSSSLPASTVVPPQSPPTQIGYVPGGEAVNVKSQNHISTRSSQYAQHNQTLDDTHYPFSTNAVAVDFALTNTSTRSIAHFSQQHLPLARPFETLSSNSSSP